MRRWVLGSSAVVATAAAVVVWLVVTNSVPRPPADPSGAAAVSAPYVVKLHARWCPVCMATKAQWGDVQQAYAGRVRFAVFDFTTEATTARSRVDAVRLGLGAVFDDYAGETGTVLVLDGVTKNVREAIHGVRAAADYRTAIDAALARTP
jgi:thiol-disulfide isomerase/thioredoxin